MLRRRAPSIVDSTILHTFHAQPLGLVLDTEEVLTDAERDAILAELEQLVGSASTGLRSEAEPGAHRSAPPSPTRSFEPVSVPAGSARASHPDATGRWQRFELRLDGPTHGNPFTDVELNARFFGPDGAGHDVLGFAAGDGRFLVRFLPPTLGAWRFETTSNARSLDGVTGSFDVTESESRGPVEVAEPFHFRYADGSRYLPIGTTSYAWTHQGDALEEATLSTLSSSPFNKIRMCVFPKSYTFNNNEPERFPYIRREDGTFDLERFDPAYWDHLEQRIDQLDALGIEADLILYHAYDRWGFSRMDAASDDRYVRYAVARLGAFRNIWWSLANEFDLLFDKTEADWERWAGIIERWDAAGHLRSIHNCRDVYDQTRPWITHVSIQRIDPYKTAEMTTEWREQWGKPVVVDECAYEGDIDQGWGNITGEEMTRRFWEGAVRGGYVGHGETYIDPEEVLWWAKGGALHGTSPDRIGFLARIESEAPGGVLEPIVGDWDAPAAGVAGEHVLFYFGFSRPAFRRFFQEPSIEWKVDVIDTWEMTVGTLPGTYSGRFVVDLPAKQYMAVRLRRADEEGTVK
ncbi:DUF5060 domain-containing protein [Curtobacterium sp. MCBD17_034]|nr:DUF5060 domain-containing protein [Curtobacterium sp. MCBD17_034]PZM32977.1 DUF5060 domain-containing protein [Curtobacterium sp. MCBD17_031]